MEKLRFTLDQEYIHLIQLLKTLSLVGSGGEAKLVVNEGLVTVNDEKESRKRYKVVKGDIIRFEHFEITVS